MPRGDYSSERPRIYKYSARVVSLSTPARPRKRSRSAATRPDHRHDRSPNISADVSEQRTADPCEPTPDRGPGYSQPQQPFSSPESPPAFHTNKSEGFTDYVQRLKFDLSRRCAVVAENKRGALCVAVATAQDTAEGLTIQVNVQ